MSNAATSHDYAHYFLTTAAPYLKDTLPYLAELLLNAAILRMNLVRERDVVLEEIRQANDDPDWLGCQALSESVYHQHPYGRSVLGTERELMQQSRRRCAVSTALTTNRKHERGNCGSDSSRTCFGTS